MNKVTIGIIIATVAILLAGIFLVSGDSQSQQQTDIQITESDNTQSNPDAPLTLVEYSDFQCPACQAYSSTLKQLNQEFPDNLRLVYRHFPLRQIHRNAEPAARAAQAAAKQEKFWQMHDLLFENQNQWSDEKNPKDKFKEYAASLDLNLEQFETDYDSQEIKNKVFNDSQSGSQLGVNSTPSFFLNGERLQNPRNYEEFKNIIQSELDKINNE